MSASTDLCTRDSVKTYLGLTGTNYDDLIDALVPAASEAIENACRRRFAEEEDAEYHDGGEDRLVLRRRPVASVTDIWDDPERNFADASKLEADEYVLDADRGMVLLRQGTFSPGIRNVKVAYTAGYSSVPDDAAQACRALVSAWFHRGREAADGLDRRAVAEVAQRFASEGLPAPVLQVLRPYREHVA